MPLLVNCYCPMYFSEHQEFSKEIGDTKDPRIREDLERELDALVINCYCPMYFSEHQEFSKEIGDTKDPRNREDLERELDALVSKLLLSYVFQ